VASVPIETRRATRLAARCPAEISFGAGRWAGLTEDLAEGGCRIVARLALRPGEPVSLTLRFLGVPFALDVVGSVAWTAPKPPWYAGVAFARGQERKARRFVRAVLDAAPALGAGLVEPGFRSAQPRRPPPAQPRPVGLVAPRAAHVRTLVLAARSQAAAGQVELAVKTLRSALELSPEDPEALSAIKALEDRAPRSPS
jgi:hypothetical protein